jgi:hypothetical protein
MFKTSNFSVYKRGIVLSEERILMQEAGVKAYDSRVPPSIGLKAGAFADVGTLILTNYRLAYILKGGASRSAAWVLGGALTALAVEKSVSKAEMDDLAKCPGSYSVPLQNITMVQTARHMGSAYLRVDNNSPYQKPAHSYILGSGWSKNEDWVNAINSAISATRLAQTVPTAGFSQNRIPEAKTFQTTCPFCGSTVDSVSQFCGSCGRSLSMSGTTGSAPPPPPPIQTPICPTCGAPLSYIQQYQRWYCYTEQKYV